jgi:hypothetical protein
MLRSYKDLKVWQKSYQLCLDIYKLTKGFPGEERYSLTSQIRRMSGETPNLLVGQASRLSKSEHLQKVQEDIGEVERMLKALIKSLENKHSNP